jgi:hypothetical protein
MIIFLLGFERANSLVGGGYANFYTFFFFYSPKKAARFKVPALFSFFSVFISVLVSFFCSPFISPLA